jgi:zinc protease
VTFLKIGAARIKPLIAGCMAVAAMMPLPSHAAAKIQHLMTPGGIEAWFVQDATVPLVAMEFAMDGGTAQDPDGKAGVGNLVADLIDEGSGELDSRAFHEHLDRRAIELGFSVTRDYFRGSLRMLKDNKDEAFDLLRMSLTSPHFDSVDVERIRARRSSPA